MYVCIHTHNFFYQAFKNVYCATAMHITMPISLFSLYLYRLVGLVVKASTLTAADLGSISYSAINPFPHRVMPVTSKSVLQWLPCQALGVIDSVPGLVSPVSVYCDWVR